MPKASSLFLSKALEGFALYKRSEGISPRTVELHLYALRNLMAFSGDRPLEAYTTHDLRAFLARLSETHASSTVRRHWTAFRSFWRWVEEDLGLPNIAKPIRAPAAANRPIHPFTEDEIRRLLEALEKTTEARTQKRKSFRMKRPDWRRDRAILLLLLDTGIRASELCRLTVGDVDLEEGEIVIRPQGSGKKSRPRVIPIGKRTRRALWDYLARREDIQEDPDPSTLPLFLGKFGKPLNRTALRKLLQRLGERAGVPNVHPHRFRHTFAIFYLRNGGDVFTLQKILGHRSLYMVRRYLSLAQEDLRRVHRTASPVDRWRL